MTFAEQIAAYQREIAHLVRIGHTGRAADTQARLDVVEAVRREARKPRSAKISIRDWNAICDRQSADLAEAA